MFYFQLTEANAEFAALLNEGVRPQVLNEEGKIQYFIVYTDGRPNEILGLFGNNFDSIGTKIDFHLPTV
jgi:hypothetical protein